jgi:ribose 5-phosphate isomerase A
VNEELKRQAALHALEHIRPGMILGLGTGSTAQLFLEELGRQITLGRLGDIVGVPTSVATEQSALEFGIPLTTLDVHPVLDLTVDGADEVDDRLNLLKGGGGALLREKIVALASRRRVFIVDESKRVARLGERMKLPVAVVPFGAAAVANTLLARGLAPELRRGRDGRPFVTDDGHYVLDCVVPAQADVHRLATDLRDIVGVVEHGLFLDLADEVIVAGSAGIRTLHREAR